MEEIIVILVEYRLYYLLIDLIAVMSIAYTIKNFYATKQSVTAIIASNKIQKEKYQAYYIKKEDFYKGLQELEYRLTNAFEKQITIHIENMRELLDAKTR